LLSERLAKEGVNIFVIARKMKLQEESNFPGQVEVIRIPSLFPRKHILEEINVINILISLFFSLGCLFVLIHRSRDYDIVHFHGASIPLFICLPFLKISGKKVISKVAAAKLGTEAGSLRGRYGIFGNLLANHIKRVDVFVAISEEIREGLLTDGLPGEKIVRITNFIDGHIFTCPVEGRQVWKNSLALPSGPAVCYAGRFVARKGIEYLFQAWERVHKAFPHAVLLMLGEGPLEESLKKLAFSLNLRDSILFLGRVDNVPDYLRASDIFVLPSLQEGLPNSLLEAMASGLPAVATRIGGVVDIIVDSLNGILADPGDPHTLAGGIEKLLSDDKLRFRMGIEAEKTIRERFSLEAILPAYLNLYRKLLS
jgi:glycosyltransferase involved in cell wall biosynthesis